MLWLWNAIKDDFIWGLHNPGFSWTWATLPFLILFVLLGIFHMIYK